MIYGIGVDLVKMSRIQAAMETWGERFQRKIFTEKERSLCLSKPRPTRYWAMRFAAKEAFSKALGVGLRQGGIRWREVEVVPNPRGKPEIAVSGRAAQLCEEEGITGMHLTLTDENDQALAVVVLEK